MRDYAIVSPRFWIGRTGRRIKACGVDTQLVALHLMSCPQATMIGIYYLPVMLIAHETGLSLERAQQALSNLCDLEFCTYDTEMEYIFVYEMASYQIGSALKLGDNRIKGINEDYQRLPELSFLNAFYQRYKSDFHLEQARENSPFEPSSKPLRSQDQDQDQEQEQEQDQKQDQDQDQEKNIVAPPRRVEQKISHVEFVFNHWRDTMQHPHAVLDDKRRRLIASALKTYTAEQLCQAITGCSYTPHNLGQNDRGERYDGLHIILRSADQIERFIRNAQSPPRPQDKLLQQNIIAGQRWLNGQYAAASNGEVHHASE